ncbi:MAG: AMP-binding protein [bacterium]|nr:AMP-binding protein [Acidimicrobiia bacterium]MCY4649132.1 AMP-binding protein [bacterium]
MTSAGSAEGTSALGENLLRRAVLGDMLRRQAARLGDKPAVIARSGGGSRQVVSYRDLDRYSNRVAHGLAGLGVERGDRVAVMSRNTAEYVGLYYGILKLGAVFSPLNPSYTPAEVARQVDHSTPRVVIAGPGMSERAARGVAQATADPQMVVMAQAPLPGQISLAEMTEGVPDGMPSAFVEESDLAMVMYTSGTESLPKGVMVTHRAMMISTTPSWVYEGYVEKSDVFLLLAPVYTMAGTGTVTNLISVGATMVMIPHTEAGAVLEAIESERVTNTSQTPTFYHRMIRHPDFSTRDLSSLRQAHVYGGPIPFEVVSSLRERASGVMWATYWGQSELSQLGILGFFGDPSGVPEQDPRWIGKAAPHVEVRVVDSDGADTEVGELLCRSPGVMVGYYRNPESTAAVLHGGWLHTGDLVRIDSEGNLFFYDRLKDMIKTGGMNVSSAEVEEVVRSHPAVAEVAVVGIWHPEWTEAVTAAVVLAEGGRVSEAELIEHCRQRVAGFKTPKRVEFVSELPIDPQGKVRKRRLREILGDHRLPGPGTN